VATVLATCDRWIGMLIARSVTYGSREYYLYLNNATLYLYHLMFTVRRWSITILNGEKFSWKSLTILYNTISIIVREIEPENVCT